MKTICFFNLKGGCGKTTSIINLGTLLARDPDVVKRGGKVLLVDTDMQSNLTTSMIEYDINRKSIYDVMVSKVPVKDAIVNINDNLDLLPSNLAMATIEPLLETQPHKERILLERLEPIREEYDYILIDCSPSFSTMTINAILCADEIFIPLQTEYYAIDGVDLLKDMLAYVNNLYGADKHVDLIFAAIHDKRNSINRMQYKILRENYPDLFSTKFIRKNASLIESPVFKESVFDYKPYSVGAHDYKNLYNDIKKRGLF